MRLKGCRENYHQRFASEILWHFCGKNKNGRESFQTLLRILGSFLRLGESEKFIPLRSKEAASFFDFQAVCLTDMPLKDLPIHSNVYGKFAIGFHKKRAVLNGFMPIAYANQHSRAFTRFLSLRKKMEEDFLRDPARRKEFEDFWKLIGSMFKHGDLLARADENEFLDPRRRNYYYEREWRSINHWHFKPRDVAMVLMPGKYIQRFVRAQKAGRLKVQPTTPVIPFELLMKF